MTIQEAIKILREMAAQYEWERPLDWQVAIDMAIEALAENMWIPVKWHEITDEERKENGYPKDWSVYLDCTMPADEEEIIITTRYGTVEKDVYHVDGEFSLDSGYDWIEDVIAWKPLPKPYKGGEEE